MSKSKFIRALLAAVLGLILLCSWAIDTLPSLFSEAGVLGVHEEASEPEGEEGLGNRDQGAEEKETPRPGPEPEPEPEPEQPADEDPSEEPIAAATAPVGNPLAQAIAAQGMAYVHVNGDVFSSAGLREKDRLGRVSGIAIATAYHAGNDGNPATVKIVFATENALGEGFLDASGAALQAYEETLEAIGVDGLSEYRSAAWPLPLAGFDPVKAEEPKAENPEALLSEPALPVEPVVTLWASIKGDKVILTAQIEGIPEGIDYALQWQNDLSGEFEDAPGETGVSVVFDMDSQYVRCMWRVALHTMDAGEGNAGDQ